MGLIVLIWICGCYFSKLSGKFRLHEDSEFPSRSENLLGNPDKVSPVTVDDLLDEPFFLSKMLRRIEGCDLGWMNSASSLTP